MANPSFRKNDGSGEYIWAELPHVPADASNLTEHMREGLSAMEYRWLDFVFARHILGALGKWQFGWKSISQAMVQEIQTFFLEDYIRFYPDAALAQYWLVTITGEFRPKALGAGDYDLNITLNEYGMEGLH